MSPAALGFEVLGPVRLLRDGRAVRSGRLQRVLLAVLLVHRNRSVPADTLIEAMWGDRLDARSDSNLRLHVHRLRQAIGDPDRLTFESGGYRLTVHPGELDAERFESLADEASGIAEREPKRAVELVREALELWRGRPYADLDVPILLDESQRLTDRRLAATELRYECELALGHEAEIVADLTDLVRRHPLHERLHALLMAALARSGRQADALQTYHDARRTLVEELGLEPGPELRAIEQQVLAGEPVQVGARADPPAPPAQLPPEIRGFVGRDDILAELDRLLPGDGAPTVVANLTGTAGVGKTALALHWAHRVRDRFPDGQLYVDLRGYGPDEPLDPSDVLAGFLRALGLEGTAIPQDRDERSARFRSLCDGRRLLLFLDNARSVDQVRPLLPGSASSLVLITSRDSLAGLGVREGAHRFNVERMSDDEARRLLRDLVGDRVDADDAAVARLIEQCARLPLALRVAADLLGSRPALDVTGLVDEFADERDRLDLIDVEDDPHSAVRAVFSWSYRQLPPDAARLFRLCGLHPGHETDVYALAALAGSDTRPVRRRLGHLVRAHLVEEPRAGRYRMHDLLRAYAAELCEEVDTEADRTQALARLAENYLYTVSVADHLIAPQGSSRRPEVVLPSTPTPPLSTYDQGLGWLERETDNLLALVPAVPDAYAVTLSEFVYRYFEIRGRYDEALDLTSRVLAIGRRTGDVATEMKAHRLLANVYYFLGDFEESTQHDQRALELCRRTGDRMLEGVLLNNIGTTHQRRGRYRQALDCFEQARPLAAGPENLVPLLGNAGYAQVMLGEYESARDTLQQGLELAGMLGDYSTQVTILCCFCELAARTESWAEGIGHGERALAMARETGNRSGEVDALYLLGAMHAGLGDHKRALAYYDEALEVTRSTGNKASVAEISNGLGRSHRAIGEATRAVREHQKALEIAAGNGMRYEEAAAHAGLGDAYTDLGAVPRARRHRQRALEIFRELGVPEADRIEAQLSQGA